MATSRTDDTFRLGATKPGAAFRVTDSLRERRGSDMSLRTLGARATHELPRVRRLSHCDAGEEPTYEKATARVYPFEPKVVEPLMREKPPWGSVVAADQPPGVPASGPGRLA